MSVSGTTLCCFGAGGHGRVVATQWLSRAGSVVFGDGGVALGTTVAGIPVLFDTVEAAVGYSVIVTIGLNSKRRELQERAERAEIEMATFVADDQRYFAELPGPGSVVLAGCVVNHGARIGRGAIINSSAVIEHDCEIGDFVHVSPNATLAGGSSVGEESWIGAGATVLPGIVIGANVVIGAGSVVNRNAAEAGTYVGVPARRIR